VLYKKAIAASPDSCFRLLPRLAPLLPSEEGKGAEAGKKASGRGNWRKASSSIAAHACPVRCVVCYLSGVVVCRGSINQSPNSLIPFLPCPNTILLLISQRHTSLTGIIQPGNNKGLTIPDYLRNFKAVRQTAFDPFYAECLASRYFGVLTV